MIEEYNPNYRPLSEEWLATSESDWIDLIEEFHRSSGEPPPQEGWNTHALYHCLIENQIALEEEGVDETVDRLQGQGLSRHDSIHAVAAVMIEYMLPVMRDRKPFDSSSYLKRLNKLTAKRWLSKKYWKARDQLLSKWIWSWVNLK